MEIIKCGDLFAVTQPSGDMLPGTADGLYSADTRCLDTYRLTLAGAEPVLLGGDSASGSAGRAVLASPRLVLEGVTLPPGSLLVERERELDGEQWRERIQVCNYSERSLRLPLDLTVACAFHDIMEVRGARRQQRGQMHVPQPEPGGVRLGYTSLDGRTLDTRVLASPPPDRVVTGEPRATLGWNLALAPGATVLIDVTVRCGTAAPAPGPRWEAFAATTAALSCDNREFDAFWRRGLIDLAMLLSDVGHGPFPVAGTPWYACPFGRDSIIASLQLLPYNPAVAYATLRTLAALQGAGVDPSREEQPGKIPHEVRRGEMARLGEVPFGRYYGSVDATPLWLVLLAETVRWTGDLDLLRDMLPAVKRAIAWMDRYGDADGDGYLEFARSVDLGWCKVQSWKDSDHSMVHSDGSDAEAPLAVVEVQGYAYQARRALADLLPRVGEALLGQQQATAAGVLFRNLHRDFWLASQRFFALALDHRKRPLATRTSDPGHLLFSGALAPEAGAAVAAVLLSPHLFSGWGVRTMAAGEAAYNPASYHNGSVWPHDNALIALGLARYGFGAEAGRIAGGLLRAASALPYRRLPELFCGHPAPPTDLPGEAPVAYPVACSPQAWAAGTPLMLLQALLGLFADVPAGVLCLQPALPPWLERVELTGLPLGGARVDLRVARAGDSVTVEAAGLPAGVRLVRGLPALV